MKDQMKHSNAKSRNRGRGYRPNGSRTKKVDEGTKEVLNRNYHSGNDASWYAKNAQLMLDACRLPFSEVLGNTIRLTGNGQMSGVGSPVFEEQLPGVMAFPVCPLPGNAQETNSPVNLAARAIYGYVRHANSGSANYDIPDIMLYLLGMDSLYSRFSYLRRIYGIVSYYCVRNRYAGRALLQAMGVDYTSIMANLSDFRQYINTYALKVGALVVPKNMSYFLRHMWMYENVYRDSEHEKSQFYLYVPEYFYKYVETGSNPGSLEPSCFLGYHRTKSSTDVGLKDFIDLMEESNELIDAMMESEDCGIISGDILKAYGDGNVWHLTSTPDDFTIEPVWNQEVLTQFHNLETLTNGSYWSSGPVATFSEYLPTDPRLDSIRGKIPATFGTVTQNVINPNLAPVIQVDNNYNEVLPQVLSGPFQDHLVDLPYSDATPDNVMVATRGKFNKYVVSYTASQICPHVVSDCGSEVISRIEVWDYFDPGTGPDLYVAICGTEMFKGYQTNTGVDVHDYSSTILQWLSWIERWDYHPIIFVESVTYDASASPTTWDSGVVNTVNGDLDNYSRFGADVLRRMNEVALLSEFDTPQAATWSLKA